MLKSKYILAYNKYNTLHGNIHVKYYAEKFKNL